ncbi:MAG: hypothetical protein ACQEP1_04600 [Nanobdellota archaeon]
MAYENVLESPLKTLYLISFIAGAGTYNEVVEMNPVQDIKKSNLANAVKGFVDSGYLSESGGGKGRPKSYSVEKEKVIEDIFSELSSVTSGFTYTFRLDGRKVTRRRYFSYDDRCRRLKRERGENVYKLFSLFSRNIVMSLNNVVDRKSDLVYKTLIKEFLLGISVPERFYKEYFMYMEDLLPSGKAEAGEEFRSLCSDYAVISSLSRNSMIAARLIHQD